MKILITNNHLERTGGTETWTYTMSEVLTRMGHDVEVFTIMKGAFAEHFNVPVVTQPEDKYDLILVNHNSCLNFVKNFKGKKIFTCHGTTPALEQPREGADAYVGVSELTCEHIKAWNPTLIRNGIDTERFKPIKPLRKDPLILVISDWQQPYDKIRSINSNTDWIGKHNARFDMENVINNYDIIVSIGRGRYEAMSCGRVCLAYDERPYIGASSQGLVTPENIDIVVQQNYWKDGISPTVEHLEKELRKYDPSLGEWGRDYIINNFNAETTAKQYIYEI